MPINACSTFEALSVAQPQTYIAPGVIVVVLVYMHTFLRPPAEPFFFYYPFMFQCVFPTATQPSSPIRCFYTRRWWRSAFNIDFPPLTDCNTDRLLMLRRRRPPD